jgi:hypothetical protein
MLKFVLVEKASLSSRYRDAKQFFNFPILQFSK